MNAKKPNNLARSGAYIYERHFNACNKKLVAGSPNTDKKLTRWFLIFPSNNNTYNLYVCINL